jgi:hypothetical protein
VKNSSVVHVCQPFYLSADSPDQDSSLTCREEVGQPAFAVAVLSRDTHTDVAIRLAKIGFVSSSFLAH